MSTVHFAGMDLIGLTSSKWPEPGSTLIGYEVTDGALYQMDSDGILTKIFPANENIYVVNDDNVADHVGVFGAFNHPTLINIPNDTTILSIETTSEISAMLLTFITTPSNGKRLDIVGNVKIWQGGPGWDTEIGRFSAYYYVYRHSYVGTISVEGFESFMYWNGVWYYRGY